MPMPHAMLMRVQPDPTFVTKLLSNVHDAQLQLALWHLDNAGSILFSAAEPGTACDPRACTQHRFDIVPVPPNYQVILQT